MCEIKRVFDFVLRAAEEGRWLMAILEQFETRMEA